jgi:hypothetical protein
MKLYIIRGAHDGNIAVATNMKIAYEISLKYINGCDEEPFIRTYSEDYKTSTVKKATYADFCKKFKGYSECSVSIEGDSSNGIQSENLIEVQLKQSNQF